MMCLNGYRHRSNAVITFSLAAISPSNVLQNVPSDPDPESNSYLLELLHVQRNAAYVLTVSFVYRWSES
jgi:hypothetical protein